MTILRNMNIKGQDSFSLDAFGRWRVSNPTTLFESKQIFDNQPLFWDELLETGAGIASSHSTDEATTVITSTINTAGKFTRQSFMRMNYQPGKSQQVQMTGILDRSGGGTGVERRIGVFDDDNGLFFEDNAGTIGVTRRTNVTGTPVDNTVAQSSWNIDVMDGTGSSKATLDWTKLQIFYIDFEWLGAGRVRFSIMIGGIPYPVHEFLNANVLDKVYMSTPNLPLRYQMITTGSSPASTMEAGCSTVASEGGAQDLGIIRYKSTAGTHVDCTDENIVYAIIGIRLKAANLGATIKILNITVTEHQGSKEYEWILVFNPTVQGSFTYSNETNSSIQTVIGVTANTVTGGTNIAGGMASSAQKGGNSYAASIDNALRLGADIAGVVDEIVLCARPIGGSSAIDIEASIEWRELQ